MSGYGAVFNTAKVEADSTVGVWGCGAVGLAVIMGCKVAGAKRIIAVDINPDKEGVGESMLAIVVLTLQLIAHAALKFGATEFFNPANHSQPAQQVLSEMTDGGLDYTFECIGNVTTMVGYNN